MSGPPPVRARKDSYQESPAMAGPWPCRVEERAPRRSSKNPRETAAGSAHDGGSLKDGPEIVDHVGRTADRNPQVHRHPKRKTRRADLADGDAAESGRPDPARGRCAGVRAAEADASSRRQACLAAETPSEPKLASGGVHDVQAGAKAARRQTY